MTGNKMGFKLNWFPGPIAQLELFSVENKRAAANYKLKYVPAARATIRPPVQETKLGTQLLVMFGSNWDLLAGDLLSSARARSSPTRHRTSLLHESAKESRADQMSELGWQLKDQLIPRAYTADLKKAGLFIEVGMDEQLQGYPWELMYDGEDYICLKHYVGRFVNSRQNESLSLTRQKDLSSEPRELSILVISVPEPLPRETGETWCALPQVKKEIAAIEKILTNTQGVDPTFLKENNATSQNVFRALKKKDYQIIHFSGHGNYNHEDPSRSKLVFHDRDMTANEFTGYLDEPPLLCFINACESARTAPAPRTALMQHASYDIFGLVRAFLEVGSYLLGSRWMLDDKSAEMFAKKFYKSLIKEAKPLGHAVTSARQACSGNRDDPFGWASYVFYGDPRVGFAHQAIRK